MPSICELKMELKAKGIKGITGLNKAGLEALLKGGISNSKKGDPLYNKAEKFLNKMDKLQPNSARGTPPAQKSFTPAATKGDTPKVAEKKIEKKIKVSKPLMITYKEPNKESDKPKKAPPKLKKVPKTKEEQFADNLYKFNLRKQAAHCKKLMKKLKIKSIEELRKYIIMNHPDKKNYDPNSAEAEIYKEVSNCSNTMKELFLKKV